MLLFISEEQEGLSSYSFVDVSVADDTCLAFKEYLQDPGDTTLDDLLPCADLASSSAQYFQIRTVMAGVIAQVQNHRQSSTAFTCFQLSSILTTASFFIHHLNYLSFPFDWTRE